MTASFLPLSALPLEQARRVTLIASDVDGTLTREGELDPQVLSTIARLASEGIDLWPVSGRPAGEVLGLCRYLPGVRRGIAENGLLEIRPDHAPRWIGEPTDLARLRAVGEILNTRHDAQLRLAGDAFCRLGDVAFERDGRLEPELRRLRKLAEAEGVHLVWSNVHVHLAEAIPDKGAGLLALLAEQGLSPDCVATIGDAPNDAGLFVADRFALTVGTADVREHAADFGALPEYICAEREADAFLAFAAALLKSRAS